MKYFKRILLFLILIFSLVSFSSCAVLSRLGFDTSENKNVTNSTSDTSSTTTNPKVTSLPTSSDISNISTTTTNITTTVINTTTTVSTTKPLDEDGLVTELDYGYGYDLLRYENSNDLKDLYLVIKNKIDEFAKTSSDINPQVVTISGEDSTYYFFDDVDYTKYNIESNVALAVLKNVLLDHPEYYFMDNSYITSNVTSGDVTTKKIKLSINSDYAIGSKRVEYNSKITEFETDCFKDFTESTTNKDKIKHIHDYIVEKAEYAFDENNNPSTTSYAHNILGIVVEGKGVCESYAELFTYLLKKSGIPALTVSGLGFTNEDKHGGAHAWNYVYIDSKYYGFDVTWDDTANTNHYYGMSSTELVNISNTEDVVNNNAEANFIIPLYGGHLASGSDLANGINYLYYLPEVSNLPLITL